MLDYIGNILRIIHKHVCLCHLCSSAILGAMYAVGSYVVSCGRASGAASGVRFFIVKTDRGSSVMVCLASWAVPFCPWDLATLRLVLHHHQLQQLEVVLSRLAVRCRRLSDLLLVASLVLEQNGFMLPLFVI